MKHFNFRFLVLFLGISFFVACKKDDVKPTIPVETVEEKLFINILGRWDIPALPVTRSQEAPDPVISSVVFSADSTVLIVINGVYAATGTFLVKDGTTIEIKGPGVGQTATIRNIVITENGISFSYSFGEASGSFTATKVDEVVIDTKDKAILGEWIKDTEGEYSEIWKFYPSGYFVKSYEDGGENQVHNWSFDSENANVITGSGFYGGFLKVTELTATTLTVELMFINNDGEEFKETEFSFSRK